MSDPIQENRAGPEPAPPTISVVMPAHDAAAYVGEAVESILSQTYSDLELIVMVDASTDETEAIVRRHAERDPRVVVETVDLRSAAEARNRAFRLARGEWIALMDADDVAYPQRLEKQLDAARRTPEAVLWGCYMQRITPEGIPMAPVRVGCSTVQEYEALDRTKSLIRTFGTVAMFRREHVLEAGGFDRRFEPMEDSELWDRMAVHGPSLVVPEILQAYRQHDQSLSVTKIELQRKWFRFITQRHAARLRGEELSLEAFEAARERWGPLRRFDSRMRGISARQARKFQIARARKQYGAAAVAAAMMLLSHPYRFARRLFPGAPHV